MFNHLSFQIIHTYNIIDDIIQGVVPRQRGIYFVPWVFAAYDKWQ
jgi:hypothetical protein